MNRIGSAPQGAAGPGAGGKAAGSAFPALRVVRTLFARRLAVGLLAGLSLLASCSSNNSTPPFGAPPVMEPQHWLFDVMGTGTNDVYACGSKGAMFHFDGNAAWSLVDVGTTDPIVRLWKEDAGNTLYAVGHKGRIWRNAAGTWSTMESGTTNNLYGIGSLGGVVHAVGQNGTICRLSGSAWSIVAGRMFLLNEVGVPVDTLQVAEDVASLVTVNNYFLGGAYKDPNYTGVRVGVFGTRGMVLAVNDNPLLDGGWILRPLSGEQIVPHEWVLCTTSDPATLSRNYLGTSEGWLFRLTRDDEGKNVWQKFYPTLTTEPGAGINDIWVDETGNVYLVTDEGRLVYQTVDYDYVAGTGRRVVLYDGLHRLTGIWGTGPDNLWIVGFTNDSILHASHNQETDACEITSTAVVFPDKSAAPASGFDYLDRPLY